MRCVIAATAGKLAQTVTEAMTEPDESFSRTDDSRLALHSHSNQAIDALESKKQQNITEGSNVGLCKSDKISLDIRLV